MPEFNKEIAKQYFIQSGLTPPVFEHRFHKTRKWRFDIAWPEQKVAIEVQGGIWTRGRHSRGKGQLNDMHKFNEAQVFGWIVLLVTPQELMTQNTIDMLLNLK